MDFAAIALRHRYGELWAMEPQALQSLMRTPTISYSGERSARRQGFQRVDRSAIIELTGTLVPRAGDIFAVVLGLTGLDGISAAFDDAMRDQYVDRIVLVIDSPGGSVFGVEELARKILAGRQRKRVVAVADGYAASAAYHIGSAASEFVVSHSSLTGGIGAYRMHVDVSEADRKAGIKVSIIRAGKNKILGNPHEPLSEMAKSALQAEVNYYHRLFVKTVAQGRQVSAAQVRSDFGRGRTMTAEEAVKRGLADRIATLETVLGESVSRPIRRQRPPAGRSRVEHLRANLRKMG